MAPLQVLERVTVGEVEAAKVLGRLRDQANLEESVLLSTCLRTEVYSVVDRFHDAVSEVQELLADVAGSSVAELAPYYSVRFDDDVPSHLFAVAAGMQSAVLGESEVLGQVRRAWERAHRERVSGPVLAGLFRHAVRTGKRVRSETGIARGTTSFAHAAVERAAQVAPDGLVGGRVVVVGAGSMGGGVLDALLARAAPGGLAEVVVVNRTRGHAEELVATRSAGVPLRVAELTALPEVVVDADLVVVAVAEGQVVGVDDLAPDRRRGDRSLVVVDLGMPRSVHPAVGAMAGVALLDMDDLRASVEGAFQGRRAELDQARAIVRSEVERYRIANRARGAAPVVAALRSRLEELRVIELARRRGRLGELTDQQWGEVEAATRAVLAKMLHDPTVLLKETAGTPRGERLVEALRVLFDL